MTIQLEERLAAALARLILDPAAPPARHIAVGAASPIPAAACWLVRKSGHPVRLSLLHKRSGNPFTEGSRELFDLTGQGRIDLFFLGGGQIDGQANLNLVGTGEWPGGSPQGGVRFPGSFGSAFMYFMTPRTILFREEHSPRVLVPRVDNISAPGVSEPGVFRRGTAQALVTGKCVFTFDATAARFTLASLHPGESVETIRAATGFDFDVPADIPATPDPTSEELALLRGPVCDEMLETYPEFCARVFSRKLAA
ncbi:CoA-transferase [Falsiroseomonas stagni]|uniref:Glutaconate CoA-transferase subunit B n=1 Tax=Falsiroseomonas stagni DSM 19981 TaxID=1123062 RepID=A0A1I4DZ21_9PROT|nr:CoA-transferase [Falsiroseomonas stagni]SFK98832.1 glutaconate CoA-transferase subunit B [Falsiroseomonas stagni DSM 19981]